MKLEWKVPESQHPQSVSLFRAVFLFFYPVVYKTILLIVLVSLYFSVAKVFRRSLFVMSDFYHLGKNPQLFFYVEAGIAPPPA